MKKKQKKIIYCNLGLANCYDDRIELNKKLKNNPILRDYIYQHELNHNMDCFDLSHEFKISLKIFPRMFWFILKTPSTWIDFLPIQIRNKKIIYDLNMCSLYLIIIILGFFSLTIFF